MNSIYVRIYGGLGNQIFQFGAALLLAKKFNSEVILNISAIDSYKAKRVFSLNEIFSLEQHNVKIIHTHNIVTKTRLARIAPIISKRVSFVNDNNFKNILNTPMSKKIYMDGYFQTCLTQEFFNKELALIRPLVKDFFKSPSIQDDTTAVIHVRGGDFVKLNWISENSREYYRHSMSYLVKNFGIKNFHLITDDEDYAMDLLRNLRNGIIIKSTEDQIEDFKTIGSYKYQILSSSTFAWWSSALFNDGNKKIIIPKYWSPQSKRLIKLFGEVNIDQSCNVE